MRRVEVDRIGDLFKFHNSQDEINVLLAKVRSGRSVFFINDEETAYLCYDHMFGNKWAGHVTALPESRGKELWDFSYETAAWMVTFANMTELFCFVEKKNKALKRFVRYFGMKDVGRFEADHIYAVTAKQIEEFKEVELCQQQ